MFELASNYHQKDMTAYVELQQAEFSLEKNGYTATKHQREVGTGYFDEIKKTISSNSSTLALKNSTEKEQF